MSATDSDNSIDWLASDNEDSDSDREFDRSTGKSLPPSPGSSPPPHHHHHHHNPADFGCRLRGSSEVMEASSRGSPQGCGGAWENAFGLYKAQPGEKTSGQGARQAPKRRHSGSTEEGHKERQLCPNAAEKKRLFNSKCMELQCYIHPLSLILNGLRSGRYRERLSSFQESVAMDRIQRIMGVLQNPCMGEKYINIILKMEEMLKSWFPNVKLQDQVAVTQTEDAVPTKKQKLSPTSPVTAGDPPALRVTNLPPPGAYSASHLKWLHTSPICSHPAPEQQAQAGPMRHLLLSPALDRDLTQDNAVSSSTDTDSRHPKTKTKTDSVAVPRGPLPGKINAPCLEMLLKSTESIITRKEGTSRALMDNSWS